MRVRNINRYNRKAARVRNKIDWDYDPTGRQIAAHMAPERYKLYGGAMGGGKSVWLCAESLILLMKYPGNRGCLVRDQLIDLRLSTLITFEKLCPAEFIAKHQTEDHTIIFKNGSELVYGGLGGNEDIERIKSREFGFFAIDEATECLEEMFIMLATRLRWVLPDGRRPNYYGLLASNPEPGWVKERFVDQKKQDHVFIPALPRDNPHLPKDYNADLRKMFPPEAARRYLDGSWEVFEGQIYKEFDRSRHVFDHDIFENEEAKYYDVFRVIDHGYRNPTCCLWIAVDFDGRMWIYDEHYERYMTIQEHALIIREKHPGDFITLCDPTMFSRTMQGANKVWSPADEYRDNGIFCIRPYGVEGNLPEISGINLVKQRFQQDQLFIHASCEKTIAEILKYRWKNIGALKAGQSSASQEIPIDRDNHAVDCIRYASIWRPTNSLPPTKPVFKNSLHWAILNHRKQINSPFFAGWN